MYYSRSTVELLSYELWKKGVLTFETREELIETSTEILAFRYLNNLEFWRCTAMNDPMGIKYRTDRINCDFEQYREALKSAIEKETNKKWMGIITRRKIIIDLYHIKLIKEALKAIGRTNIFACGIPTNVTFIINLKSYKIKQLMRSQ